MCENFEGPEKNLIMYFSSLDGEADLRKILRVEWDRILLEAKCAILSKTSTFDTDSYVLSESSLFVKKQTIIIKTCGTTALLHCLNPVILAAKGMSFKLESFYFFRKNFEFPQLQEEPHQSFSQECSFMTIIAEEKGLLTAVSEVGDDPENSCYLFIANSGKKSIPFKNRLYILMYGLSENASKLYVKDTSKVIAKERTEHIQVQVDSAGKALKKDDFLFEPCGYSMNSLYKDGIATVHITPEDSCSYASYETDVPLDKFGVDSCVQSILGIFQPRRYSVIILSDGDESTAGQFDTVEYGTSTTCSKLAAGKLNLRISFSSCSASYETEQGIELL